MPAISTAKLKMDLKENKPANLYLIYGDDINSKDKCYCYLIKKLLPDSSDFNLSVFDEDELDVLVLADTIEMLPVMSDRRLVSIKNLNIDKISSDDIKYLGDRFKDIPETTVVILKTTNADVTYKKNDKWNKFLKVVQKTGDTIEMLKPTSVELAKKCIKELEKEGISISMQVANYLVKECGEDSLICKNEVEKYINSGLNEITMGVIDKYTAKSLEDNVFEISKNLIRGNLNMSLKILDDIMMQKESGIMILATINSNFVDMYRVKVANSSGSSLNEVATAFSYPKNLMFKLNNANYSTNKLTVTQLRRCLEVILDADLKLKGFSASEKVVLESALTKIYTIIHLSK